MSSPDTGSDRLYTGTAGGDDLDPHIGAPQLCLHALSCLDNNIPLTLSMESTGQKHTASPPLASEETHKIHSPEPIEAVVSAEFPLVARLTQGLEECDWDQLQEKYTDAMDEHSRVEEDLRAETAKLLEVMLPII